MAKNSVRWIADFMYQYVDRPGRPPEKHYIVMVVEDTPLPREVIASWDAGIPDREGFGNRDLIARSFQIADEHNDSAAASKRITELEDKLTAAETQRNVLRDALKDALWRLEQYNYSAMQGTIAKLRALLVIHNEAA